LELPQRPSLGDRHAGGRVSIYLLLYAVRTEDDERTLTRSPFFRILAGGGQGGVARGRVVPARRLYRDQAVVPALQGQRGAIAVERTRWLDPRTDTPLLQRYARRMRTFLDAMADGIIQKHELNEQEARLVALMKEVNPKLEDSLHEKVTNLRCELTVYDLIQMLHTLQEARPTSRFRG
jgi:hypothetical protein